MGAGSPGARDPGRVAIGLPLHLPGLTGQAISLSAVSRALQQERVGGNKEQLKAQQG